jgi:hypothetical protein
MTKKLLATILFLFTCLLVPSVSLFAHHGNASFDYDKKVPVSGTVTQWIWANPHSLLRLDVKDDKGEVTHWVVEAGGPQDMARQGWSRDSFKPGDEVTFTVIQAKNGQHIGRFTGQDNITVNGKPFAPTR